MKIQFILIVFRRRWLFIEYVILFTNMSLFIGISMTIDEVIEVI